MRDLHEKSRVLEDAERRLFKQQRIREMLKINLEAGHLPSGPPNGHTFSKMSHSKLGPPLQSVGANDESYNLNSLQTTFINPHEISRNVSRTEKKSKPTKI
mmetsp:Transcript_18504/g.28417  ORF Transcript_18504/g.28417 Transcript_18504/m.28417 type:complete len:101 (-) Transcript_18504:662-964(-)